MSDAIKFYGIWDGRAEQWVTVGSGTILYFESRAVASASLNELKKTDGRYLGNKALKVAEIPEDGGEPKDE